MEVVLLSLHGLRLVRPKVFFDDRGFFEESYHTQRYRDMGIDATFVQDNYSFSHHRVLRGMHAQEGQGKLVWVSQGKIFDVAVDIRPHSSSWGQWEGVFLDGTSMSQLWIPPGFAHGFCVVSPEGAHVHYKISSPYDPNTETSFRYDDPQVSIAWPIREPILSARDRASAPLQRRAL